jgi:hypothetical protein
MIVDADGAWVEADVNGGGGALGERGDRQRE